MKVNVHKCKIIFQIGFECGQKREYSEMKKTISSEVNVDPRFRNVGENFSELLTKSNILFYVWFLLRALGVTLFLFILFKLWVTLVGNICSSGFCEQILVEISN